jgi:hypothetical protein
MQTPIPAVAHTIRSLLAGCVSGTAPWRRPDEFSRTAGPFQPAGRQTGYVLAVATTCQVATAAGVFRAG